VHRHAARAVHPLTTANDDREQAVLRGEFDRVGDLPVPKLLNPTKATPT